MFISVPAPLHRRPSRHFQKRFRGTGSSNTAWKRDNLRVALSSAPSIEETGLDFSLYGEGLPFFTPREQLRKTSSLPAESILQALSTPEVTSGASREENYFDALDALPRQNSSRKEEPRKRNVGLERHFSIDKISTDETSLEGDKLGGEQMSFYGGQGLGKRRVARRTQRKLSDVSEGGEDLFMSDQGHMGAEDLSKGTSADEEAQYRVKRGSMVHSDEMPQRERSVRFKELAAETGSSNQLRTPDTPLNEIAEKNVTKSLQMADSLDKSLENMNLGGKKGSSRMPPQSSEILSKQSTRELPRATSASEGVELMEASSTKVRDPTDSSAELGLKPGSSDVGSGLVGNLHGPQTADNEAKGLEPGNIDPLQSASSGTEARNRWRRAKHKLAFVHHLSEYKRSAASDFLVHGGEERAVEEFNTRGDGSKPGAPVYEPGAGWKGPLRARGREGMEGMVVRQDKGIISLFQDFYVACLKMPIGNFLVGVFLAPIALGLLFTPIFLIDKAGLSFNGVTLAEEGTRVGRVAATKQNFSALMNVFLYALSLSTTFGGSPVAALSPFCLCVANVNTLMGQFLFVFLSGAVFARMSQPSHPVRCSKKAVIRTDDFTALPSEDPKETHKVFAVRLVLTGPPPCELVDAKICLTFRILIKLPSGSMFCSTRDLELMRPEVPYLKYGILVRHVIDNKSPVYGQTMESLMEGDASFSLTVMGLERTSMQPIFHLEDYFVCDGDVAWDADYIDFIHINKNGHRVLDHSKIDLIKVTKDTKMASSWKDKKGSRQMKKEHEGTRMDDHSGVQIPRAGVLSRSKSSMWRSKSTSFTRADW